MDRWEPMNNPLELTGRVLGLSRPDAGRVLIVGGPPRPPAAGTLPGPGALGGPASRRVRRCRPSPLFGPARPRPASRPSTPRPTRSPSWAGSTGSTSWSIARGPRTSSSPSRDAPPGGSGRGSAHLSNSDVAVHWVTEEAGADRGRRHRCRPATALAAAWPWPGNGSPSASSTSSAAALGLILLSPLCSLVVSVDHPDHLGPADLLLHRSGSGRGAGSSGCSSSGA